MTMVDNQCAGIVQSRSYCWLRRLGDVRVVGTLTRRSARERFLAAALLCLVAHGVFVSVTHHHSASGQGAPGFSIESGDTDGSGKFPQSGDDSNCVSCRVSRSFNSLDRSEFLVVQFPVQAVVREKLLSHFLPDTPDLVLSGRGPPLA